MLRCSLSHWPGCLGLGEKGDGYGRREVERGKEGNGQCLEEKRNTKVVGRSKVWRNGGREVGAWEQGGGVLSGGTYSALRL